MRRDPLAIALILLACGCQRTTPTPNSVAPPTAAKVSVVKPQMQVVRRIVEQPGTVQPFEETVLVAKFPAYVKSIAVDPAKAERPEYDRLIDIGSHVSAGQLLAELAVPEWDEEFKQKQALVRQAEAGVTQSQKALVASNAGVTAAGAKVAETQAGLTRAQALSDRWQSESARVSRLVSGGVIDSQSQDETQNQLKAARAGRAEAEAVVASAEAAVSKAEADRDKAASDVVAAEAMLDVAKANVRRIEALRGYTRITAPYDGIVTRRAANIGDYVSADGKRGLFAVARLDPVRVVIAVPEAEAGFVVVGQEVRVTLQAVAGPPVVGKVARSSWSLEPGSRTLRTEVDLPNPGSLVRPGMYVTARLVAELPAAWSLPVAALGKIGDDSFAYLVENGKAVRVVVEPLIGDVAVTQIRRFQRLGVTEWSPITGTESFTTPASAVTDGQAILNQ